jgi:hypothetical protein
MRFQKIRVCLKELDDKSLERDEVHLWVWIEEVKVDLNPALLNKFQRANNFKKKKRQQPSLIRCPLLPLLCVLVFVSALSIKINQGKRA